MTTFCGSSGGWKGLFLTCFPPQALLQALLWCAMQVPLPKEDVDIHCPRWC